MCVCVCVMVDKTVACLNESIQAAVCVLLVSAGVRVSGREIASVRYLSHVHSGNCFFTLPGGGGGYFL